MQPIKSVMVIGGGLGGLLFAQAMQNRPDIKVTVYERDEHGTARSQGYQIGVNKDGRAALEKVNLPGLAEFFEVNKFLDSFLITDENIATLMRIRFGKNDNALVNRWKLRDLLANNVNIVWNKKFVKYEEFEDRVVAHFEDGTTAEADVLVGSDGVKSKVRAQRTDAIVLEKLAVRNSAGFCRLPPREEIPALHEAVSHSLVRVIGYGGYTALLIRFKSLDDEDFLVWAITNSIQENDVSFSEDKVELKKILAAKGTAIHPEIGKLIDMTTLDDMLPQEHMNSAVARIAKPLGPTTRVTLLGDSAHAMTSHRGLGANTAFQDAIDLAAGLQKENWRTGLAQYEEIMLKRGFKAVAQSKSATQQMTSPSGAGTRWMVWAIGGIINVFLDVSDFFKKK